MDSQKVSVIPGNKKPPFTRAVSPSRSSRILALLSSQAALLGFSASILYTAANSLFLSRYGSSRLPVAYIATAVTIMPIFALLLRQQKRWSLSVFCLTTLLTFSCLLLVFRLGLSIQGFDWLMFALMIAVVLVMQTNMIVLGSQATVLWDVQVMKRRYPLVMAGQITGVIAGGGLVGPLSRLTGGTPNLIFVSAASLGAGALLGLSIAGDLHRETGAVRSGKKHTGTPGRHILKNEHIRRLLAFRISLEFGSNLVKFLFLSVVDARFHDTEAVTSFLGGFMAAATLLTLFFLLLVSGRILMRFGVSLGLAGNPVAVGASLLCALVASILTGIEATSFFILILAARLVNFVVVTGLTDSAVKAAVQPLDPRQRSAVQTVMEGVGVPLAVGLAGAVLLGIASFPGIRLHHIALFSFLIMILVSLLAVAVFRSYRRALEQTLTGPRVSLERISIDDGSSLSTIMALFDSPEGKRVKLALKILENSGSKAHFEKIPGLLEHPDPEVRVTALLCAEKHRMTSCIPPLRRLIDHETKPAVLSVSLRVLCSLDPDADKLVLRYVKHENPDVRLGACSGLLRSRGIDGALSLSRELRHLLESTDIPDRVFLARLVGEAALPDFYAPLQSLLSDDDTEVRREALKAASQVRAPGILASVVDCMEDIKVRSDASAAIIAFGGDLIPLAADALTEGTGISTDTRLRLIRACGRLHSGEAVSLLSAHLEHPDPETRYEITRALSLLRYNVSPDRRPEFRSLILSEIEQGLFLRTCREELARVSASALVSAIDNELDALCRHVCILLSIFYGNPGIIHVYDQLRSPDAKERGLAREILEVTLDRDLRSRVLDGFDHESLHRMEESVPEENQPDRIAEIVTSRGTWPYPWVIACAVYTAVKKSRLDLIPPIESFVSSGDPRVERTARWALGMLKEHGKGDSDMVDVERVILLKSSPIFEETPDRALASLAALADRLEVSAGETIIHRGDLESCLYVIAGGKMRVHDGERTIATLATGEIIGEMALLDPAPRSASVTALEDSVLFRLDKEAFDITLADNPEIAHGVLRVLCRRLRTQIQGPA